MKQAIPIGHPELIRPGLLFSVEVERIIADIPHPLNSSIDSPTNGLSLFVSDLSHNYIESCLGRNDTFCTLRLKKRVYFDYDGDVLSERITVGNKVFAHTNTLVWEILCGEKILAVSPKTIAFLCRNIG